MSTIDKELFELCKQVYEATKWRDTESWIEGVTAYGDLIIHSEGESGYDGYIYENNMEYEWCNDTPLYTSDYLLEKLPNKTYCGFNNVGNGVAWKTGLDYDQVADTPLKALLKITLELHKRGELKQLVRSDNNDHS